MLQNGDDLFQSGLVILGAVQLQNAHAASTRWRVEVFCREPCPIHFIDQKEKPQITPGPFVEVQTDLFDWNRRCTDQRSTKHWPTISTHHRELAAMREDEKPLSCMGFAASPSEQSW